MNENRKVKLLGFLLGVIILFGGVFWGYLYFGKQTTFQNLLKLGQLTPTKAPVHQPLPSSEALVTINKDGFEPATISITKGSQVTWVNKDGQPHQIASDPHPAHSLLPDLFLDEPLTTDSSFTFTFEKEGIFTYHDELNPLKLQGVVIAR